MAETAAFGGCHNPSVLLQDGADWGCDGNPSVNTVYSDVVVTIGSMNPENSCGSDGGSRGYFSVTVTCDGKVTRFPGAGSDYYQDAGTKGHVDASGAWSCGSQFRVDTYNENKDHSDAGCAETLTDWDISWSATSSVAVRDTVVDIGLGNGSRNPSRAITGVKKTGAVDASIADSK